MILWEGDDSLLGGRSGQNGENREQQQRAEAVALPLRAARIADCAALPLRVGERGKQGTKQHQGDLHQSGINQGCCFNRAVTARCSFPGSSRQAQATTPALHDPGLSGVNLRYRYY